MRKYGIICKERATGWTVAPLHTPYSKAKSKADRKITAQLPPERLFLIRDLRAAVRRRALLYLKYITSSLVCQAAAKNIFPNNVAFAVDFFPILYYYNK
ncbi:MAG: hypothetical protein K2K34_10365 [Oscillospiraceae bacterium]|nr:hypothetical protein [Oscillospiraceae bacterium]